MKSFILFQDFFAAAKKPWERKQLQEPLLRKGFLKISPKGRGIRAFEARMLHTHENFRNTPPTGRRGLFGCSLPANYYHGRLYVDVILFFTPTDGSAHRGDLVGMGVSVCLIPKHLCKPKNRGGEAAGSWRRLTLTNVGVTSLHLDRRAPPFGKLKTFFQKVLRGSQLGKAELANSPLANMPGERECRFATSPNWRWRQFFFQKFPLARPSHPQFFPN